MRILVGDDHPLFRVGFVQMLGSGFEHAQFLEASSFGEMASTLLADDAIDLVLCDLGMPDDSGPAGLARLRALRPDVPLVVVSASDNPADMWSSIDAGAAGYIPKSSSVKVMISALNLVMSGGQYLPPGLFAGAAAATAVAGAPASPPALAAPAGDASSERRGRLTERQLDILSAMRAGRSNKEIAFLFGLSEGTVKIHITSILRGLGVRNRTQAVIAASTDPEIAALTSPDRVPGPRGQAPGRPAGERIATT